LGSSSRITGSYRIHIQEYALVHLKAKLDNNKKCNTYDRKTFKALYIRQMHVQMHYDRKKKDTELIRTKCSEPPKDGLTVVYQL
jgi:hypothetical protein